MEGIDAKDALKYAFSQEMLKIYGIILIANVALMAGFSLTANWAGKGGTSGLIGQVLGSSLVLAGLIIGVGGLVAFIYKLIVDANRRN